MYTKHCSACGASFSWPTAQKSLCVGCERSRDRDAKARYVARRSGQKFKVPLICPSCGVRIAKGRRMCRLCARVRRANSSAATSRLRRSVLQHSAPQDGGAVPGELFAPSMTQGGWVAELPAGELLVR